MKEANKHHHYTGLGLADRSSRYENKFAIANSVPDMLTLHPFQDKMYKKTKRYSGRYILFSIACAITIFISCQEKKSNPGIEKATRELFRDYFVKEIQRDSVYLSVEPDNYQSELCIELILSHHKEIKETKTEILEKIKGDTTKWTSQVIPGAIILNKQDLVKVQHLVEANKTKDGIFTLSHPVFFNDLTLALVKVNFFCGKRCGQSGTLVFEKKNNEWHLIKTYCTAIA